MKSIRSFGSRISPVHSYRTQPSFRKPVQYSTISRTSFTPKKLPSFAKTSEIARRTFHNSRIHHAVDFGKTPKKHSVDLLVIVDFEATCDRGDTPVVTFRNSEIIEFPWVVFDLEKQEVIDEQQIYVKPVWTKTLPQFCIELTGITDDKVMNGPTLQEAIRRFDNYVSTLNRPFCLMTDGQWDLCTQLRREASAKGIKLEHWYRRFFNLKTAFTQTMGATKDERLSLKLMSEILKTPLENYHSGIDDCRSISHVLKELLKRGAKFTTPQLVEEREPVWNDFNPPPLKVTSPVVFIRGMNENTTPEHISEFFKDEKLEKIDLIKNSNGKFMGRAFIEFPTVEDAKKAFKKNHKLLHGSIISLEMSNEQDRRSILSQMK